MNNTNNTSLKTLATVYVRCDVVCEQISLLDIATDHDLDMHLAFLDNGDTALRQILALPVTSPEDAAVIADLIAHMYKSAAEIGDFPIYDMAVALLDKLISATPASREHTVDELQ